MVFAENQEGNKLREQIFIKIPAEAVNVCQRAKNKHLIIFEGKFRTYVRKSNRSVMMMMMVMWRIIRLSFVLLCRGADLQRALGPAPELRDPGGL